jgi:hypothetical protein
VPEGHAINLGGPANGHKLRSKGDGAWNKRGVCNPSYSAFRRDSGDPAAQAKLTVLEHYLTEGARDRIGNYSDRHRLGRAAGSALLTRGSFEGAANPTNSGLFRRVRDLLETTHRMQTAARRTSVQRDNFSDALLPLATAARIYRSRGGAAVVGMFLRLRAARQKKLRCYFSTQSAPT